MRIARALACAAGAVALTVAGTPAFADEATPIHLAEVYDVTPGVSATHEVTLSTDAPLLSEQCQSMGTGARATSTVSVEVNGVAACRFTWDLDDSGAEVLTVDDGGVFHFHSVSASLLEGFSSPEALASMDSVTLVAHASEIVEASEGGAVTSAGVSTKTDASTVTWTNVRDDVTATGTVNADAAAASPTPSVSPTPSPSPSPSRERGGGSSRSSLTPIFAITGGVLALVLVGAFIQWTRRSRQAAADAQFDWDASVRASQREAALEAKTGAAPYASPTPGSALSALTPAPPAPEADSSREDPTDMPPTPESSERFAPPPGD